MKDIELNIRIAEVAEIPPSHLNRWELLRYSGEKLTLTLTSQFGVNAADRQVQLRIRARYSYVRGMVMRPLASVGCSVTVDIDPFPAELAGANAQLPPRLMTIMYSTAVGALRGMIAMRVAGTALSACPLPLVNISELVSNHLYGSPVPKVSFPLDELVFN